jgi:hypothetical protein
MTSEATGCTGSRASEDVEALDALIDAGADLEASGAVLGGGSPLADAVGFGQWNAAAVSSNEVRPHASKTPPPSGSWTGSKRFATDPPTPEGVTDALWAACHAGQRPTAEYLLERARISTGPAGTTSPLSTSPSKPMPPNSPHGSVTQGAKPANEFK